MFWDVASLVLTPISILFEGSVECGVINSLVQFIGRLDEESGMEMVDCSVEEDFSKLLVFLSYSFSVSIISFDFDQLSS